ncbi:hypothetical protein D3C81_1780680 [compost metagenome]
MCSFKLLLYVLTNQYLPVFAQRQFAFNKQFEVFLVEAIEDPGWFEEAIESIQRCILFGLWIKWIAIG